MAETPGIQEDYASYLHCLMHLTQMLTNAHDLLYPSKSRSIALAKAEHYYKHIDDFTESQCKTYCVCCMLINEKRWLRSVIAGRRRRGELTLSMNVFGYPS
jgi:hypothetical protein